MAHKKLKFSQNSLAQTKQVENYTLENLQLVPRHTQY